MTEPHYQTLTHFPGPEFVRKAALGEVADVLLTGQHVLPARAVDARFTFRFADVNAALRDIVSTPAEGKSAFNPALD